MDNYDIYFDEKNSSNAGLRFLSPLEISAPVPRSTEYMVPGRNGTVHIYDGSFENRTATITGCLYNGDSEPYVKRDFAALNEFLFGSLGYRKLVTLDDPTRYMLARVANGAEVVAKAKRVAPFTIRFDCKPQIFLESGNTTVTATNGLSKTVNNPTGFTSVPLLKINFSTAGTGTVVFNGTAYTVSTQMPVNYGYCYYDPEIDTAYIQHTDGTKVVFDGVVTGGRDISLVPGNNTVTCTGAVTNVVITPRWWTL